MLRAAFLAIPLFICPIGSALAYQVNNGLPERGFYTAIANTTVPLTVRHGGGWLTPQAYIDAKCPGGILTDVEISSSRLQEVSTVTTVNLVFIVPDAGCKDPR